MQDIWKQQATLIERGKKTDFPLGEIVYPLGVISIFFADRGQLTFHQLNLGMNDIWFLAPDVQVDDDYEYNQAIVIKKKGKPMATLCTGIDAEGLPIAALFNLTKADSLQKVIVVSGPTGAKRQVLENNHYPAGGLGLSRILRGNPQGEMLHLVSDEAAFSVSVLSTA